MLYKKNIRGFLLTLSSIFFITLNVLAKDKSYVMVEGEEIEYNVNPITLLINNNEVKNLPMSPFIYKESLLVPLRETFEPLGATVEYRSQNKEVVVYYDKQVVLVKVNNKTAFVNNKMVEMSIEPKIVNEKVMIPLRFVAENIGLKVDWDGDNRVASVLDESKFNNDISIEYTKDNDSDNQIIFVDNNNADNYEQSDDNYKFSSKDISNTQIESKNYPKTSIINVLLPTTNDNQRFTIKAKEPISEVVKTLYNEDKLIIDIKNSDMKVLFNSTDVKNSKSVSKVRIGFSNEKDIPTTRVVLDLLSHVDYSVSLSDDRKNIYIDFPKETPGSIINVNTNTNEETESTTDKTESTSDLKNIFYDFNKRQIVIAKDKLNPIDINSIIQNDMYNQKKYTLIMPREYKNFYGSGSHSIKDKYIESVEIKNIYGLTHILINENQILAPTITEDETNIYIKATLPKEKYDKIVVIDAGHGGVDNGATGNGVVEKDINYAIAKFLYDIIQKDGTIKAYLTRSDDIKIPLEERAVFGNDIGDIFISIHSNSAITSEAYGIESYYYPHQNDSALGFSSKDLADLMQTSLLNATGANDRKVKTEPFYVIKFSNIPAVLLEVGFVSNLEESKLINSNPYRKKLAQGIFEAITECFKIYTPKR